jgi:O-antigen/teichoic acid export membrane protein
MRVRFFSEYSSVATPAALLIAARIANMVLGLAVIPVLLTFLGTEHFAAWALLLALGAAFSLLELSMPPTYVRAVAPLIHAGRTREARQVTANALCIVFLSFGIASVPLIAAASVLVKAVGLPDGQLLSAVELVVFVFIASSLRALLQFGSLRLNAARKFGALAASSFLQSFSSNLAAALAAIITGTLEYAVIAFWIAQLLALTAVGIAARIALPESNAEGDTDRVAPSYSGLRELLKHALPLQVYDWAQVVSYQFDKFVIAAISGLPSVALYEIGNRSVLALRSIPASGIDSFLATASIGQTDRDALWKEYVRITKLAFVAVVVFILAPLAVAPFLLYAWTGDVGFEARWVFANLAVGAAFSIVALPAAAMVQAAGRSDLQARAALASLLINVPVSYILVNQFGPAGAAAGTATAMSLSATLLVVATYRAYTRPLRESLGVLRECIPMVSGVTLLCTVGWIVCAEWIQTIARSDATPPARATAAAWAIAGYVFVLSVLTIAGLRRLPLERINADMSANAADKSR